MIRIQSFFLGSFAPPEISFKLRHCLPMPYILHGPSTALKATGDLTLQRAKNLLERTLREFLVCFKDVLRLYMALLSIGSLRPCGDHGNMCYVAQYDRQG